MDCTNCQTPRVEYSTECHFCGNSTWIHNPPEDVKAAPIMQMGFTFKGLAATPAPHSIPLPTTNPGTLK